MGPWYAKIGNLKHQYDRESRNTYRPSFKYF